MKLILVSSFVAASLAVCLAASSTAPVSPNAPVSNSAPVTGTSRQTGLAAGTGILSAISSMFPSVMSNMLPLVLLFGLGALMVPALGLGLLLREGRRQDQPIYYYRSFPSFNINTSAIVDGLNDVFDRFIRALDNVDKKYK